MSITTWLFALNFVRFIRIINVVVGYFYCDISFINIITIVYQIHPFCFCWIFFSCPQNSQLKTILHWSQVRLCYNREPHFFFHTKRMTLIVQWPAHWDLLSPLSFKTICDWGSIIAATHFVQLALNLSQQLCTRVFLFPIRCSPFPSEISPEAPLTFMFLPKFSS